LDAKEVGEHHGRFVTRLDDRTVGYRWSAWRDDQKDRRLLDGQGLQDSKAPEQGPRGAAVKNASTDDRLDTIIELLKLSVALQLAQSGVKQTVIAKHIHVATAKVGTMLQGVRRPGH